MNGEKRRFVQEVFLYRNLIEPHYIPQCQEFVFRSQASVSECYFHIGHVPSEYFAETCLFSLPVNYSIFFILE
jgi:hypothetical protein